MDVIIGLAGVAMWLWEKAIYVAGWLSRSWVIITAVILLGAGLIWYGIAHWNDGVPQAGPGQYVPPAGPVVPPPPSLPSPTAPTVPGHAQPAPPSAVILPPQPYHQAPAPVVLASPMPHMTNAPAPPSPDPAPLPPRSPTVVPGWKPNAPEPYYRPFP